MPLLLVFLAALVGCTRPVPLGLTRVQVCLTAEKSAPYEGPPRLGKGASVCADFEPAPVTEVEE